jgi:uncharacterized protein Smg (DUF494 family)
MKEKVVEILIYLMSEIQDNKRLSEIDLVRLRDRGYTQAEISAAFSWLHDNSHLKDNIVHRASVHRSSSRRVLHEAEKFVFSVESQGYLIQLRELGLLNDMDLENVIERAMASGYDKLSLGELREIVSAVLFTRGAGGANPSIPNNGESIN